MSYKNWNRLFDLNKKNEISGRFFLIVSTAYQEFLKITESNYDFNNYKVIFNISNDLKFYAISFFPLNENVIDEVEFEIANEGTYRNGIAVTFYYEIETFKLVDTWFDI